MHTSPKGPAWRHFFHNAVVSSPLSYVCRYTAVIHEIIRRDIVVVTKNNPYTFPNERYELRHSHNIQFTTRHTGLMAILTDEPRLAGLLLETPSAYIVFNIIPQRPSPTGRR